MGGNVARSTKKADKERIKEAEEFLKTSSDEFKKALKMKNKTLMRDACEKAWLAVFKATSYLFEKKGIPAPKSHYEARKGLEVLEKSDKTIKDMFIRDRFSARDQHLHIQGFYEGSLEWESAELELEKVKSYIDDVKKL